MAVEWHFWQTTDDGMVGWVWCMALAPWHSVQGSPSPCWGFWPWQSTHCLKPGLSAVPWWKASELVWHSRQPTFPACFCWSGWQERQLDALMGASGRVLSWISLSIWPAKACVPAWHWRQLPRPLKVPAAWQALHASGTTGMLGWVAVPWQAVQAWEPCDCLSAWAWQSVQTWGLLYVLPSWWGVGLVPWQIVQPGLLPKAAPRWGICPWQAWQFASTGAGCGAPGA